MKDFYRVLGLDCTATQKEIKTAYKKLAKQYHPDKWVGEDAADIANAEVEFKHVEEAYRVLKDPVNRAHYDTTGEASMPKSAEIASKMLISLFQKHVKKALEAEMLNACTNQNDVWARVMNVPANPIDRILLNIEKELKKDQAETKTATDLLEKGVKLLNKHKRRIIKKNKKGSNLYAEVVAQQLQATSAAFAAAGIKMIALSTALQSLDGYEYVEGAPELRIDAPLSSEL